MDFNLLTSGSDLYNFHSHTQFCDGKAPMEMFAAEAVERGFSHYGFSPHSPVPISSPCNMAKADVPVFLDEVRRLREKYAAAPTRFWQSMEIDYLGPQWGPSHGYFHELPLDYRIGSVHFISAQNGNLIDIDGRFDSFRRKMADNFHNDIRYVVNTFYDQSLEMISRGGFDIIGHYDKIGHNASHLCPGIEEEGWYADRADELTEAIIASGIAVEINTKAWAEHHRMFPAMRHWRRLADAGTTLLVNSDAHVPALIDASRREAFDMLHSVGHSR